MKYMGGGERLCCETIRALLSRGDEVTLLSEAFDPRETEDYFGYHGLFDQVRMSLYPSQEPPGDLGTTSHIIHHLRGQKRFLREVEPSRSSFELLFSTQDPSYFPDLSIPVVQWGYIPRPFPKFSLSRSPRAIAYFFRRSPLRLYYERKVARIGFVLAISQYAKEHLDEEWRRPSVVVYPACNMVDARQKRNLVVTVARALPIKRLELFWKVAAARPQLDFIMVLTRDPAHPDYSNQLVQSAPANGKVIFNASTEQYHGILGEAKVYLHFMEEEHFGITVVEAMSALCVPIVHDSGGPKETVDSRSGFLWKTVGEIPQMLDNAIGQLPSNALRERAENFSVEKFQSRLSSILLQLHG